MSFCVSILASGRNGTLYVGMTEDLLKRVAEHKAKATPGFTSKYGVAHLVWYEQHDTREGAFVRERRIKKWNRAWKLELIERFNPRLARPLRRVRLPLKNPGSPLPRG